MDLGVRIFRLRSEKKLSQDELAQALGVSRQSVSKWENGASVPELDKLVQMSELFGVSLDELVKGAEPPPSVPAEPPAPAAPEHSRRTIVGVILLCFGALVVFLLFLLGGGLFSLLYGLPFLSCGIICLTVRSRAGLWCAWAAWLCVELYLRYATGLCWETILLTLSWTAKMNYMRLIIAWVMALVPALLIFCTVRSFRGAKLPFHGKPLPCLCAWAAVIGAWFLRNGLYQAIFAKLRPSYHISGGLNAALFWTRCLGDWLIAALLCVAFTWTLALLRERKQRKT